MIVDCSKGCCNVDGYGNVCNQGCSGGWQWSAFFDITNWGGVEPESAYPYTGSDGSCHMNSNLLTAKITNYTCLSNANNHGNPVNEDQLAAYLQQHGPISIALNADLLQDYGSGVIDPWFPSEECDPSSLDHALLLVGWGIDSGIFEKVPYWLVKNSWGADWGEQGYFRIYRGGNTCGLANAVSSSFF